MLITSVMPSAAKSASSASTSCFADGSRLAVGSSRNSRSGRTAQPRARARRCCSPPESDARRPVAQGAEADARAAPAPRARRAARSRRPAWASQSAMRRLFQTERRSRNGPLEHHRLDAGRSPHARATPRVRQRARAAARSRLVLPEPLAPTTATNSPCATLHGRRCATRLHRAVGAPRPRAARSAVDAAEHGHRSSTAERAAAAPRRERSRR